MAPEYVLARAVLLDALEALGPQRAAVILVGAQAVYVHSGDTEIAVAPMTTDSDLALDVDVLASEPEIAGTLVGAGFMPGAQPGRWLGRGDVAVDVMVVPFQSGRTNPRARSAALPPHARCTARITPGLEPSLVDRESRDIAAFDPADSRVHPIAVAGPAALLVAKLVKIEERVLDASSGRKNRVRGKDALDAFRLLRSVDIPVLAEGFGRHRSEGNAARVSFAALSFLRRQGTHPAHLLPRLTAGESAGDPTVALSFAVLAGELLAALD